MSQFAQAGTKAKTMSFSVPIIKHDGKYIGQTLAICQYLAEIAGLVPTDPYEKAKANEIGQTVCDFVESGNVAYHPVAMHGSVMDQLPEAEKAVEKWCGRRALQYMNYFETNLRDGPGTDWFFPKLCYIDAYVA